MSNYVYIENQTLLNWLAFYLNPWSNVDTFILEEFFFRGYYLNCERSNHFQLIKNNMLFFYRLVILDPLRSQRSSEEVKVAAV